MTYKLVQEAKVEGLGHIGYVDAPFDEALKVLQDNEYDAPIEARDLAFARRKEGAESSLSQYGSYIKQGVLYTPKQNPLLTPASSILNSAKKATQAHRDGKESHSPQDFIEKVLSEAEEDKSKDPKERRVLIVGKRETYDIPTESFGDDEVTLWLFKDQAGPYGEFLHENNIEEMPVWLADKAYVDGQKPFERQLWLHRLGNRSELYGYNRVLYYYYWVCGVSRGAVTAEGGSQKTLESASESYTPKQIADALESLELKGLERLILDKLNQKD